MHAWINITHPGFSGRQEMPDDGDQWVSWEQMVATLRAKGEAEGRAALLAREVIELRGEVAKLKPLEFLLLKGGDPVQQLSEAVLDLSAKVRQMEEASRLDQSEILRLTRCVAEVIHARRVVVPELTDDEIHARLIKLFPDVGEDAPEREWCFKDSRWAYNLAASRARVIPADHVPGEGMIQVDERKWDLAEGAVDLLEEFDGYRAGCSINSPTEFQDWRERVSSTIIEFDALRANQGGAAT